MQELQQKNSNQSSQNESIEKALHERANLLSEREQAL